jgi:hypothetical protein
MSFTEYSKIQSDYATYSPESQIATEYKEATDDLKPLRPPTAPAQDIQKIRREILDPQPSVLFLQIALFLVFLGMLMYVFLPAEYAHMITFLLLCVGISIGFFLKK